MLLEGLRKELVFYGKQMIHSGLVMHTGGNLSIRDPKSGLIVIKPSSLPYETITPEDVPVIDQDGKVIEGKHKASSEWPMHTLVYRNKPHVMSVVHTHSIYATACSIADIEIPIIQTGLAIHSSQSIKTVPFEIPGSIELGEKVIEFLSESNVVLLKNHGPLAIGADINFAYDAACAVEQTARMFFIAKGLGRCDIIPQIGIEALRSEDPLQIKR
jgi:L-ribulose-5-phosphate 4-epimerase